MLSIRCLLEIFVLVGVPHQEQENLPEIFEKICNAAGIPTPTVTNAQRRQYIAGKKVTDGPIIVQLKTPGQKIEVLKGMSDYKKAKNDVLRLKDAGFDSDAPMYVSENLTKKNHEILLRAKQKKKKNELYAAFALRGLVHVTINENNPPVMIETLDQLEDLFRP